MCPQSENNRQDLRGFDYSRLIDKTETGLFRVQSNGAILQANHHFYNIIGQQEETQPGTIYLSGIFTSEKAEAAIRSCLRHKRTIEKLCATLQSDHEKMKWVEITIYPVLPQPGQAYDFEGFLLDITRRKKLELSENLYEHIYNNTIEGIMVTDRNTNIVRINSIFEEITGYRQEEVLGKPPVFLQSGQHDQSFYRSLWASITHRGRWEGEIRNRRKNGELYSQWLSINCVKYKEEIVNYIGIFTNINADKQAEKRLSYLAYHDALTGLPNRNLLLDRLEQNIERAQRFENQLAVLFLDLDGFKQVNDTYGHFIGDQLLMVVAQRLQKNVRRSDTVARLGGDEFCIVLSSVSSEDNVQPIIKHLSEAIAEPFVIENNEITLTGSIGVSIYPKDGVEPTTLLEKADEDMYRVKRKGKNNLG